MEDRDIIALFWDRDQRAIAALEEKYGGLCRSAARNILDSREDAEECLNDGLRRVWDTIPPQRPSSLRAYLAKIVRNLAVDRWRAHRAQKRDAGLTVLLKELEDCLPAVPSAEEIVQGRETARCISRWLETLPKDDRVAFVRRYWYGESVTALAGQMDTTPKKMAQRLFRLRGGLRRALEQEGISV